MSQKTVQLIIGRILTDDELRSRFVRQPGETLTALRDQGFELSTCEVEALVRTDRRLWNDASSRIDPSLQRCSLALEPEHTG